MPIDPKKLEGQTDFDQKFLRIIDEHGWHVMSVVPRKDDDGDAWSYSTGLFYHYQHPEIIIFNEPTELRHSMINSIGDRVKAGEKFEPGKGYADILGGGFDVQFRTMHLSHYKDWVNFACWFYDDDPNSFPVLQCFYPDMKGKFPWQRGCEKWAVEQQPLHDQPSQPTKQRTDACTSEPLDAARTAGSSPPVYWQEKIGERIVPVSRRPRSKAECIDQSVARHSSNPLVQSFTNLSPIHSKSLGIRT